MEGRKPEKDGIKIVSCLSKCTGFSLRVKSDSKTSTLNPDAESGNRDK